MARKNEETSDVRIKDQLAAVEAVKQTNDQLKTDLIRESRESRFLLNPAAMKTMKHLQSQIDLFSKKIDAERNRIDYIDKQIAAAQVRVFEQRKKVGGVNASAENNQMIARQISTLENRLEKALAKFNNCLASNRCIRERIESLRRERVVFDGIYRKLEYELHARKKEMSSLIDESNEAYRARDKAQSEMTALRQQGEKERLEFENEWAKLNKLIEEERKKRDEFRQKEKEKALGIGDDKHKEELWKKGQECEAENDSSSWNESEITLSKMDFETEKSYKEAFERIREATGIDDSADILNSFLEAEEKNFSLFNYVNSLNNEIERLELSIAEQKGEIEKYRGKGVSTDSQQKRIMRNLESQIAKSTEKADEYEERYSDAVQTVNQLKQGIHSIYLRLGTTNGFKGEEFIGNQGVTEANMMQYLGLIEQRTNEILAAYAHSQNMGDESTASSTISISTPSIVLNKQKADLVIRPPSIEELSSGEDSDEESERPMTRTELKSKTLKGMLAQVAVAQ